MRKFIPILILFSFLAISVFANSNNQAVNINIIPNPFTNLVTISSSSIHQGMDAVVTITDSKDNLVKTIFSGIVKSEFLQTTWNGTNDKNEKVRLGKYFVNITTNSRYLALKKVVILK